MNDATSIIDHFTINDKILRIVPHGSGHIHQTYRVSTQSGKEFILQQINTNVFRDPEAVMHNIHLVTLHIKEKLKAEGIADTSRNVLNPVNTKNGGLLYTDSVSQAWRCYHYITAHKTYDKAVNESMVYEGGKAYGQFLQMLSDLSPQDIRETIPGFHNMPLRISQFEDACNGAIPERMKETTHEISLLLERKEEMLTIHKLGAAGIIPVRIVHHDTKINNVLFDENDRALCVIDLDTVMPGFVHDDFGDSIRTFTNTGEEDDPDTDSVSINMQFFRAYTAGFLSQVQSMLTETEKQYLALSARALTYMQSLRFLADYLNGDTYYHINSPKHNLLRTRAQVKLMLSMEENYTAMVRIINNPL